MVRDLIRFIASFVLPAIEGQDSGTPPEGGGPTPSAPAGGEPAVDVADLMRRAEELERVNAQLRAAEATREQDIRTAAENLLLEVMPEYAENRMGGHRQEAPREREHPSQDPGYYRPPQAGADPGEGDEATLEERIAQGFSRLDARQQAIEDQFASDRMNARIGRAMQQYPHADPSRVRVFLANQGAAADRINIEKLVEISHNKELRRMTVFAENYHREKLAEITRGGNPPPLPGRGVAAPVEQPKITRKNAASVLAERMAAAGFGRG